MSHKRIRNPKFSVASVYAGNIPYFSLIMICFIFFNIIKGLLFPNFENNFNNSFLYPLIVFVIISFIISVFYFEEESLKYFKEFDKKKGWWRIKWKFITFLTPIVTLTFALGTTYTENFIEYLKVIF